MNTLSGKNSSVKIDEIFDYWRNFSPTNFPPISYLKDVKTLFDGKMLRYAIIGRGIRGVPYLFGGDIIG